MAADSAAAAQRADRVLRLGADGIHPA